MEALVFHSSKCIQRLLFLLPVTICCQTLTLIAQPAFEKVFGGIHAEKGTFLRIAHDKGYIISGTSEDSTYHTRAYYLLKLDSLGNKAWERSYGDAFQRYVASVIPTWDGGYAFTGTRGGPVYDGEAEVVRTDSLGNITASNTYPPFEGWGTTGVGLIETLDSNLAVTVYTDGFISQNYYSLLKLAPDLSTFWSNFVSYDGSLVNPHDAVQNADGYFYTLGFYDNYYFSSPNLQQVSSIRKFTRTGVPVLDSLYQFNAETHSVARVSDGGLILCGRIDTLGSKDVLLIRLDSTGQVVWRKRLGSGRDENGFYACQTSDGGFIVASDVNQTVFLRNHDIQLVKLNAAGDSLWSATFGGTFDEQVYQVEESEDHGFVILGSTTSFGDRNIYVVKTDSVGRINTPYSIVSQGHYFCDGDTVVLQLVPTPPLGASVIWSTGDSLPSLTVAATANYYATITDSLGISTTTAYYPVFFGSIPNALLSIRDTAEICQGSEISFLGLSDPSLQFSWWLNGIPVAGATSSSIIPQSTGLYSFAVNNFCGMDSANVYLDSLYDLPVPPGISSSGNGAICPGDSTELFIPFTPDSIQWWYAQTGPIQPLPAATDSLLITSLPGNYFVQVTDKNGCRIISDAYSVYQDNFPVFVNASGPISFCQGGQTELNAPSGSSYLWSTGDTVRNILVGDPGQYFFSMVNTNGCFKQSDTITIHVNLLPSVYLGQDTTICNSDTLILDAGSGFNNYLWQNGSTQQTLPAFTLNSGQDSATYMVFVTDTNGCNNSDTVLIRFDVCQSAQNPPRWTDQLYPNPVLRKSLVTFRRPNQDAFRLRLIGLTGEILFESEPGRNGLFRFRAPDYPGVYYCQILYNSGRNRVFRLIVE